MNQSQPSVAGGFAGWPDCQAAWKTANDCVNSQAANSQIGYQNIKTVTLDASNEGVRYTPVGAGIQIDDSSGTSEILITQIQSNGVSLPTVNTPPSIVQSIADAQLDKHEGVNDVPPFDVRNTTESIALCAGSMLGKGRRRFVKSLQPASDAHHLLSVLPWGNLTGSKRLVENID